MVVVDNAFPGLDGIHCALLVAVLRRQFVKPVQALGAAAEPRHLARGEITAVERQLLKEQQRTSRVGCFGPFPGSCGAAIVARRFATLRVRAAGRSNHFLTLKCRKSGGG